jgi:cation transport ATPase
MADKKRTNHTKKRTNHNSRSSSRKKQNVSAFRKFKRFIRRLKTKDVAIIWLVQLLAISLICMLMCGYYLDVQNVIVAYLNLFSVLVSVIIGFYYSYYYIRKFDRGLRNDDFSIWLRRVSAIVMTIFGVILFIVSMASLGFVWLNFTSGYLYRLFPMNITYSVYDFMISDIMGILLGVGIGLLVFSLYMEFTFERRAGFLFFGGRQRF